MNITVTISLDDNTQNLFGRLVQALENLSAPTHTTAEPTANKEPKNAPLEVPHATKPAPVEKEVVAEPLKHPDQVVKTTKPEREVVSPPLPKPGGSGARFSFSAPFDHKQTPAAARSVTERQKSISTPPPSASVLDTVRSFMTADISKEERELRKNWLIALFKEYGAETANALPKDKESEVIDRIRNYNA